MADYGKYQQFAYKRELLQIKVNSYNMKDIDIKMFTKTPEERKYLNAIKSDHKQGLLKRELDPTKHMN